MTFISKLLSQPPISLFAYPEYLGVAYFFFFIASILYILWYRNKFSERPEFLNFLFFWLIIFFTISRLPVAFPARFARELALPLFVVICYAISIAYKDRALFSKFRKLDSKVILILISIAVPLLVSRVTTVASTHYLSGYPFEIIAPYEEAAFDRIKELSIANDAAIHFDYLEPFNRNRKMIYIEQFFSEVNKFYVYGEEKPEIIDTGKRIYIPISSKQEIEQFLSDFSNTKMILVAYQNSPDKTDEEEDEVELNEYLIQTASKAFQHKEVFANKDNLYRNSNYASKIIIFYN